MITETESSVGRFSVEVELANDGDLLRAGDRFDRSQPSPSCQNTRRRGYRRNAPGHSQFHCAAARPEDLGQHQVRYADGRVENRAIATHIHLTYGGRDSVFNAIVEPDRESALIGAIVLEDLDFVVDCANQRLMPRDPNQIISEAE